MSFVVAVPDVLGTAATDLGNIGSTLSAANAGLVGNGGNGGNAGIGAPTAGHPVSAAPAGCCSA